MNKKVLLIFCLIMLISSVACVSASEDFNQTNMKDTGNADGDILSISPDENEIVSANTGNFTQLQEMINGAQEGSNVTLNMDYEYNSEFSNTGIIIDKPLIINGNGNVIDAKNASRIFQITANANVTLNNITLKNGFYDQNGGAIYVNGSLTHSTFKNLKFIDNTAGKNGGALYFKDELSKILFENVTFENNVAQRADSGAVNFHAKISDTIFDNVIFYNNSAKRMGDPTSHSMGGAVNIDNGIENCLFNNTLFMENTAKNSAGALSVNGKISALAFENTRFINNTAELEDGGAIHIGPWKESNLAGATFKNVTFDGNNANNNGGALYVTGETSSNIFEDVKFINNTAKTANGGAICLGSKNNLNTVKNTFENVTFADNTANSNGGALYIKGASSTNKFIKVNFTNNVAQRGDSGAVNFYAKISDTIFDNVIFYNNSAKRMGSPTSHSMGGAVNIDNGIENCLFNNTLFMENTAKNSAGALSVNGKISALAFENTRFINNTAELEDGGAIHIGPWKESNLAGATFKNVTFDGNNANNNGGALYVTGETSSNIFEDVKFINNTAKTANGGAIFLSAKDNLNTVNNTFENVTFADNTANSNGGALYIKGASSSNAFEKAVFINNTGQNVIYIKQSDSDNIIRDSIFINNDANKIVVKSGTVQMTDDWFGNNATNYNEIPDAEIVLDNWLFLNATATPNAIAINETSTVNFKLFSYNKGNVEEYDGPINVLLGLSSTLGSLDQNYTLIDEDILYTASESGNGSVTGKFENAYYTIVLKNKEITEINVTNSTLELEIDTETETGATLIPSEAGNLTYTSSNESVAVVDNGKIIALNEGTATITVSFEGNDDYAPAENKTIFVTVKDSYRNITAEELIKLYGNPKPFVVNVTNSRGKAVAGETVSITINGVTYNKTTDENGTVSLNINLPSGDYPVNITVGNYTADSYVYIMPTITGEDVESEFRNVIYYAMLVDFEGIPLENGTAVKFNINGEIYTGYISGDIGIVGIDLILNSGNYTITATNPISGENQTNNIIINAKDPSINVTADPITFGENATVTVTLPEDATGNVNIGNETFSLSNGTASAVLTNLPVGNTTAAVTYSGDNKYNPIESEVTITVTKASADIIIENDTVALNVSDDIVAGATLTPADAGNLTYTSSNESIAIVKDGKIIALAAGNATITVSFEGNENYTAADNKTIGVIVTEDLIRNVVAENLTKYYHGPETFNVNVTNSKGKAVCGETVLIKINGITYNKTTDENGIASLNISLSSGNYTVTTTVGNITVESVVEVLTTILGEDVESEFRNVIYYAMLVDFEGIPLENGTAVKFNIKGKIYTGYVSGDIGIVGIDLILNSGNYTITATNPISGENQTNNIIINAKDPSINVTADPITEGENATVTVTLPEDATGTVTVGNEVVPIVNGTASAVLTNLPLGNTTVPITYSGDDKYNSIETEVNVTVNPAPVPKKDLNLNASAITLGENVTIFIMGLENATGNITVTVGENNYTSSIIMGFAIVSIPRLDENVTADIYYPGDENYNNASTTVDIIVKMDLNLTAMADPIYIGENATVIVTGFENATGNVTVIVDRGFYNAFIIDGTVTVSISGLNNTTTAYVIYLGDENYNIAFTSVNITVNPKENATISIDAPSEAIEGDNVTVTVTLPGDATGTVTIGNEAVSVVNGTASAVLTNIPAGNTTVPITYSGDDKYNPIETEINISVKEVTSDIISAPDVTKYYGGSERFVVTVTDYKGNPLANKTVIININGRNYTRTTDANGTAGMAIGLPSNVYNVTVTVDNQTVKSVVTVLSTVNGTDVVKMYRNGTQYYATFLDSEGKYLADGTEVQFNINGVMYNRKVSGDKGLARLNINLPAGEYTITATNPKTGEKAANNITVLPTIVENRDITKYYKNGTQYTVKVLGADGKPVGANETVTFNINGVMYKRTTNESGIAKLNINLVPGDYVITAEYNGYKVANNITVLPVLSAEDITMKYRDGTQFVAKLVDGQGKPYVGQGVQFNINGVLYIRYTDSSGQAKLNINLMAGEYIITSSYNGANIANKITITA